MNHRDRRGGTLDDLVKVQYTGVILQYIETSKEDVPQDVYTLPGVFGGL